MSEGQPAPASHDIRASAEIEAILRNVQEVTINGAFANDFSFNRRLRGEAPTVVKVDTGRGYHDYGDKGYERTRLGGDTTGLVDVVQGRAFPIRTGLPPSLASDTQLLIIDTMQPADDNPYGNKSKDYAVVSYTFEQNARDFVGRSLGAVGVRALLPQAQTDQLLTVLKRDPDAIEDFYHGVADGLEDGGVIKRVKSDRLAVIDFRGIPDKDRRAILERQMYGDTPALVSALELQGRIPRLAYKKANHGTVDPKDARGGVAQVTTEERVPHVDPVAGKSSYEAAMNTFKGHSQGSQSRGGFLSRLRRGN